MGAILRKAFQLLRLERGFFAVSSLTLGLVAGACVAMAVVLQAVLYAALPVPEPDALVQIDERDASNHAMRFSIPNLEDLQAADAFTDLSVASCFRDAVRRGDRSVPATLCMVDPGFLQTFRLAPRLGRGLDAAERQSLDGTRVYVSERLWHQLAEGDAAALGTLSAAGFGESLPVLGVLPAGFDLPGEVDAWFVQQIDGAGSGRNAHWVQVYGRLKPELGIEATQARLSALAASLKQQHGSDTDAVDFRVTPLAEALYGRFSRPLWLLMGGVLLLWLIGCANVGALLSARNAERVRSLATRIALGARAGDLRRERWVELGLIGVLASVVAVLVSSGLLQLVVALEAGALPRAQLLASLGVHLPGLVLMVLGTQVVCGCAAALLDTRVAPAILLAGGRGQTASRARVRGRAMLVVTQLALSVVLLSGAALLVRGLLHLQAVPSGFAERGQWIVEVAQSPPEGLGQHAGDSAWLAPFAGSHVRVAQALQSVPGVRQVGASNALPLTEAGANGAFWLGPDTSAPQAGYAEQAVITDGYVEAMGMQLLAGRGFAPGDDGQAPHVALISAAARDAFFPGRDPVGLEIFWSNMDGDRRGILIVGVVSDVRAAGLDRPAAPLIYLNAVQRPVRTASMAWIVDALPGQKVDPAALRRAALATLPQAAVNLRPLRELRGLALAPQRFQLLLTAIFAGTAALLCGIGLYGLLAYLVRSRGSELGVRLALGARRATVAGLVLHDGLRLAVLGVACGGLLAALAMGSLQSLVHEVSALDPANMLWTMLGLSFVVLLASAVPAWRASRIPPARVLGS